MCPHDEAELAAAVLVNVAIQCLQTMCSICRSCDLLRIGCLLACCPLHAQCQITSIRCLTANGSPAPDIILSCCIVKQSLLAQPQLTSLQVEEFDSEIESLQSNVKRKQKPPPRLAHLEESVNRHKTHIGRLEQIIRLLDNDALHPDELSQVVNEEIAEYIDRNQEDFDAYEVRCTLLYSLLTAVPCCH